MGDFDSLVIAIQDLTTEIRKYRLVKERGIALAEEIEEGRGIALAEEIEEERWSHRT